MTWLVEKMANSRNRKRCNQNVFEIIVDAVSHTSTFEELDEYTMSTSNFLSSCCFAYPFFEEFASLDPDVESKRTLLNGRTFTLEDVEKSLESCEAMKKSAAESFFEDHAFRCGRKLWEMMKTTKTAKISDYDATLLSLTMGMGALGGQRAATVFFHGLARRFEETLSDRLGHGTGRISIAAFCFSLLARQGILVGCSVERRLFESLRFEKAADFSQRDELLSYLDHMRRFIRNTASRIAERFVSEDWKHARYIVKTVLLLAGEKAVGPEFWLPKGFFDKKNLDECMERIVPSSGDSSISPLADFAYALDDAGRIPFRTWWTISLLDESINGYRDITSNAGRSRSSWHPRDEFELRCASPLETPGFFDSIESLRTTSKFGERLYHCFVLSCLDAFSVSPRGFDLERILSGAPLENPVVTKDFEEWFPGAVEKMLRFVEEFPEYKKYLKIPVLRCLSTDSEDGKSTVLERLFASVESEFLDPRNAISFCVLSTDPDVAKKVSENPGFAERALLSSADAIVSLNAEHLENDDSDLTEPRFERKYIVESGSSVAVDAAETLARFMPDGSERILLSLANLFDEASAKEERKENLVAEMEIAWETVFTDEERRKFDDAYFGIPVFSAFSERLRGAGRGGIQI